MTITETQARRASEDVFPWDKSTSQVLGASVLMNPREIGQLSYAKAIMVFAPWIQHDIGCGINNIVKPEHNNPCDCGLHAKLGIEP
jgi:hypothetical protein